MARATEKNRAVDLTLTLPGITRPRGRPRTGKAKTSAQRMAELRARRKAAADEFPSQVTKNQEWD